VVSSELLSDISIEIVNASLANSIEYKYLLDNLEFLLEVIEEKNLISILKITKSPEIKIDNIGVGVNLGIQTLLISKKLKSYEDIEFKIFINDVILNAIYLRKLNYYEKNSEQKINDFCVWFLLDEIMRTQPEAILRLFRHYNINDKNAPNFGIKIWLWIIIAVTLAVFLWEYGSDKF